MFSDNYSDVVSTCSSLLNEMSGDLGEYEIPVCFLFGMMETLLNSCKFFFIIIIIIIY